MSRMARRDVNAIQELPNTGSDELKCFVDFQTTPFMVWKNGKILAAISSLPSYKQIMSSSG